jgi:hypothetical protein
MELLTTRRPAGTMAKLAFLAAISLLVACGPSVIEGRPPFVGISAMSLQGDRLTVDFRVSNENGVPMTIQAYELTLSLDGEELLEENRQQSLPIDANSAEPLMVERVPGAPAHSLLLALERGERSSLPFELSGRVRTEEDGSLRFDQKGHLYPVPGKPGHFRSAVTHARDLQRDEDI